MPWKSSHHPAHGHGHGHGHYPQVSPHMIHAEEQIEHLVHTNVELLEDTIDYVQEHGDPSSKHAAYILGQLETILRQAEMVEDMVEREEEEERGIPYHYRHPHPGASHWGR